MTSTTNDNDSMKKPCRNPSGIPPMSFDSEDESSSDGNDLNASSTVFLSTVEGETTNSAMDAASSRDPPVVEEAPSSSDTINEEENDIENDNGDDHDQQQEELSSFIAATASLPTTDELPPRVPPPSNSTRGDDKPTTSNSNAFEAQVDTDTTNDSNSTQKEEVSSSSQQERLQMPPHIIKAALQEEVQLSSNIDAPEMVPETEEEQTTLAEDEKKSDEKSDTELMPPPARQPQQAVYHNMPPRVLSEQESFGQSSVHSALPPFPDPSFHIQQQQQMAMMGYHAHAMAPPSPYVSTGGRRKIILRLQEDAPQPPSHARRPSFFFRNSATTALSPTSELDRGTIAVSWFEGTTSAELQEHVRRSLIRKMGFKGNVKLHDLRIIDESMDPPEEIVLSPFIPDGSRFLLRFSTKEKPDMDHPGGGNFASRYLNNQIASTAPVSPSAAPSPHHSSANLLNLSEEQLATLGAKLKGLDIMDTSKQQQSNTAVPSFSLDDDAPVKKVSKEDGSRASTAELNEEDVMMMDPDDQIEARMRQLTDLLINESRRGKRERLDRRQEKKQVIFVMANYFVLFLSLIAIMAEIQSRAPRWLEWAERNLESVQSCATDQESLFKCVSNGDFSGLLAAVILWFGRSAATRRIFLFGFETPKRLWTVVYESLVTSFCWGISYMFIRRGMNPDTRQNFISKYWKDAVYGSLAGFNASFLKAVLKNLIPQEALEDALQERHIKILSFLPSFH